MRMSTLVDSSPVSQNELHGCNLQSSDSILNLNIHYSLNELDKFCYFYFYYFNFLITYKIYIYDVIDLFNNLINES